jgi:hypothetical protein
MDGVVYPGKWFKIELKLGKLSFVRCTEFVLIANQLDKFYFKSFIRDGCASLTLETILIVGVLLHC